MNEAQLSLIISTVSVVIAFCLLIVNIVYSNNIRLINQSALYNNFINNRHHFELLDLFDEEPNDVDAQLSLVEEHKDELSVLFVEIDSMIAIFVHPMLKKELSVLVGDISKKSALSSAVDVIHNSYNTLPHLKRAITNARRNQLKLDV